MPKSVKSPTRQGLAKAFGKRVRELRNERTGLSQEDFADQIGVHRTIIGRVERGETNITFENIFLICSGLKVTLSDFFSDFEKRLKS